MEAKKFFTIFLSVIVGAIVVIAGANYYFDYYGVFHTDNKRIYSNSLNDRFVKMRYLLTDYNYTKYDSYLWGSSRVMKMDSRVTEQKTYNLGAPAGMTEDCLQQLQLLKKNGADIQTIYIGLDDFSYYRSDAIIRKNSAWILYQDNIYRDMETYSRYLLTPSILKRVKEDANLKGNTVLLDWGVTYIPEEVDKKIEEDPSEYVISKKFMKPTVFKGDDGEFIRCIENLRAIKNLCKEYNIEMKVFFMPHHMTTYLNDDMELMNRFKKELAKISPFWDFSGVNYVTANNYFWYETSHPRVFICDKILDTVSGQNQMTWVPDFGVYVTEENVDAFCEKAVRDREAYDPNHEQWVPSAEERAVMTKRVNYPW